MSIYPVRLAEWYPAKPKHGSYGTAKDQRFWHKTAKMCVEQASCRTCGKKPKWRWAWGMHSIPWGHGWEEIWCSKKCLQAKKKGAP